MRGHRPSSDGSFVDCPAFFTPSNRPVRPDPADRALASELAQLVADGDLCLSDAAAYLAAYRQLMRETPSSSVIELRAFRRASVPAKG